MKALLRILFFSILIAPCLGFSQLRFANGTNSKITIAIGYYESGRWYSDGWWTVDIGKTKTVYTQSLSSIYEYYFHAYQSGLGGNGKWAGKAIFCAPKGNFKLPAKKCESEDRLGFQRIDLGSSTNFTLTLTSSNEGGGYPKDQVPLRN